LSSGLVIPLSPELQIGAVVDYSSRAPVAEELYSNGPHLTTNSFEVGNINLDNEKATNIAVTVEYDAEEMSGRVTLYSTQFSDFIFQQAIGAEEDGLPVVAYNQQDAKFYGLDAELTSLLAEWEDGEVELSLQFDWINASLDISGNDHIPRTPPLRFGMGVHGRWGPFSATLDYLRADNQTDVAPQELASENYYDLDLYLGYEIKLSARADIEVFIQGKNLGDEEQRHHVSFIKDFAPAPGRTFLAGLKLNF